MESKEIKVKEKEKVIEDKSLVIAGLLAEPMQLSEVFMQSGMFKDVASKSQACVKILAGRELGIAPLEAMSNIFIVGGKVALQSKLIAALIKRSKRYDYAIESLSNTGAVIIFYQIDGDKRIELGKSSFDAKDAALAGLINKETYKSYPKNMFFARAKSNGARFYCADVFCGYSVEEMVDVEVEKPTTVVSIEANGEVKNEGTKE